MRGILLVIISVLALGCGEWVRYQEQGARAYTGSVDVETISRTRFDHSVFDALLGRFVVIQDGQHGLDYTALASDGLASASLAQYLSTLRTAEPSALQGQGERLAFWLNAYNALVIEGVLTGLAGDPGFRVDEETFRFFSQEPRLIAGFSMTLDQLENGVIRGDFQRAGVDVDDTLTAQMRSWHDALWGDAAVDPRIHVALNCGAVSCPNLLAAAWLSENAAGETLDQQLQAALVAFLGNASKGAGAAGISQIFTWFSDDFVSSAGSVETFVRENREGGSEGVDLDCQLVYNWALNSPDNLSQLASVETFCP